MAHIDGAVLDLGWQRAGRCWIDLGWRRASSKSGARRRLRGGGGARRQRPRCQSLGAVGRRRPGARVGSGGGARCGYESSEREREAGHAAFFWIRQ
jgi:hypothetical protein